MTRGQHNKRQEPRVGVRAQGIISPWTLDDSTGKATAITIRDLSPGGICILSNASMQRGFRFVLQLSRVQRGPLLAVYEVRYSKALTSSLWAVGGKLVNLNDTTGVPKICGPRTLRRGLIKPASIR